MAAGEQYATARPPARGKRVEKGGELPGREAQRLNPPKARLPWPEPGARREAGPPAAKGTRRVAGPEAAKAAKGAPPFGQSRCEKEKVFNQTALNGEWGL